MKQWCWAGALVATFTVAGCENIPRIPESADDTAQRFASFEGNYRIGVDDRVQIAVWRNPELSVTAPVRVDPTLRPGLAFMTLHFPDEVETNVLTIDATDPKSGTAEFKASAIRVEKLPSAAAVAR